MCNEMSQSERATGEGQAQEQCVTTIQVRGGGGVGRVKLKEAIPPKTLSSLVAERFLKGAA